MLGLGWVETVPYACCCKPAAAAGLGWYEGDRIQADSGRLCPVPHKFILTLSFDPTQIHPNLLFWPHTKTPSFYPNWWITVYASADVPLKMLNQLWLVKFSPWPPAGQQSSWRSVPEEAHMPAGGSAAACCVLRSGCSGYIAASW